MKRESIQWQLSLSYAGIALLATLLLGIIMLGILSRYFAIQESEYLIKNAYSLGERILFSVDETVPEERLTEVMQELSFYVDAQIRVLDAEENLLADSGLPQLVTKISFDERSTDEEAKKTDEDANRSDKNGGTYSRTISVGRPEGSPFSNWLFSFQVGKML